MQIKRNKKEFFLNRFLAIFLVISCFYLSLIPVFAMESSTHVTGNVYEFDKSVPYEITSATASGESPLGTFTIRGELKSSGSKGGVPAYSVNSENISFYYIYDPSRLDVMETEWHLADDNTKKVDGISLDQDISSGALIVQSSQDKENWVTDVKMTDIFADSSILADEIYTTRDIQLQNGCYYRVLVVYGLQRKLGESKILFVTKEDKEEKKIAEVYEFYAVNRKEAGTVASAAMTPRKELGSKIKTELDKGYAGNIEIDKDDPHYGWNLGTFVVNGYTRDTLDEGKPVFLKNVGDKVALWFTLTENIRQLNGKSTLSISEDTNGYDQYFEIGQTDFKHGILIIQYTDHEGNAHDPVIYTDFLAANAATGADTRVQLFEEGDYEVALDYEIRNNPRQIGPVSVIPTYTNYKIFFRFAIRNGNCMVYPFDTATGAELADHAICQNGFKLDMAKSRYLTIDVTRTVLNIGADGTLTEDVRFNRPAKDNEAYTDEGIYTFTVKNLYTGETTIKTIYVGTDKYLMALSKNLLTVEALNEKITQDATIDDDGTVIEPVLEVESELEPEPESSVPEESGHPSAIPVDALEESPAEEASVQNIEEATQSSSSAWWLLVLLAAGAGIAAWMMKNKRKGDHDGSEKIW